MRLIVRQIDPENKMSEVFKMQVLQRCYGQERIEESLDALQVKEQRVRKLTLVFMMYFVMGMSLWSHLSQSEVLREMGHHVRLLFLPLTSVVFAGPSALSGRRVRLGVDPVRHLFETCCEVMSQRESQGGWKWGRRLMAIDGTWFDVADTPANAQEFGRSRNQRGEGPFPQVRCVQLMECGSHATVGVSLSPRNRAERTGAMEVIKRSVQADMLVLHDAGLISGAIWSELRAKRAHVIAPIPATMLTSYVRLLADGSYLAAFVPEPGTRSQIKKPLLVRVIEYRITDERLGEPERVYRLGTTLLNPRTVPPREVIEAYHERWEIELVIDEQKTHVRQQQRVLRSKTPQGVYQELYGLFLLHYALRSLMQEAASEQGLDPDRLSLTRAIQVVQQAVLDVGLCAPEHHEALFEGAKRAMREHLLAPRRLRINPRVLKKLYRKYKQKKRKPAVLVPKPFRPQDRFLDFVRLK